MIPRDIEKWDTNQWMRQMVYCKPSSSGAVGVVFAWAGRTYVKQSFSKPSEAAFIIKPLQGSAVPVKFAKHFLSRFVRAKSPDSKPILRSSLSGSGLMLTLKIFRDRETDAKIKARWSEVFQHYDQADTFLIQETQVGIKEFGDECGEHNELTRMLRDTELMMNLGKLFAADSLIGDGDRLSNMNPGNIILKNDGTLFSIETNNILTNYKAILNDSTIVSAAVPAQYRATDYIVKDGSQQIASRIQQADLSRERSPAAAPSFALNTIFDLDTWWKYSFRTHLEAGLSKLNPLLASPPEADWNHALMNFRKGAAEGIRQINSKVSDFNWLAMKNKYKNYVSRYGGDPNLDWMNIKIRCEYIKLRKNGLAEDQALKAVQDCAAEKMSEL